VLKNNAITTCIGLALVLAVLPARADEYDDGLIVRARDAETTPALAIHIHLGGDKRD